jgi:hypothetical protein
MRRPFGKYLPEMEGGHYFKMDLRERVLVMRDGCN